MTFSLFADNPETYEKKKHQQISNIHEKMVLVAIKTETRKKPQKAWKNNGNVENGPQNGSPDAVIFWSFGSFLLCQTALGAQMAPKASPKSPQDQPKPRFPSILA